MLKQISYSLIGVVLGAVLVITVPALATTSSDIITSSVVYKKIVDVQHGLKNSLGNVKVNDNLTVTGNLHVDGTNNLTVNAADVQIQTSHVSSTNGETYLESTNLQNALDNELAIDLPTLLPGTTWTVQNITSDPTYSDSSGQITFGTDTLTIDSGKLAALGVVNPDDDSMCSDLTGDVNYSLYNNGIVYATWNTDLGNGNITSNSTAVTMFVQNTDSIGLVGSGGCGQVGSNRISILTRVP